MSAAKDLGSTLSTSLRPGDSVEPRPFGATPEQAERLVVVLDLLEAEDRIEKLEAENKALREGLRLLQCELSRLGAVAARVVHKARRPRG